MNAQHARELAKQLLFLQMPIPPQLARELERHGIKVGQIEREAEKALGCGDGSCS